MRALKFDSFIKNMYYALAQLAKEKGIFAFGGEEGVDKFDANIKYRSSLQNFVIDNGEEIILVDTGTPEDLPEQVVDEKTQIFLGNKIKN